MSGGLIIILPSTNVGMVMCSVTSVCVRVSVCPVRALTFESLDLETSSLACTHIFKISTESSYIGSQKGKETG